MSHRALALDFNRTSVRTSHRTHLRAQSESESLGTGAGSVGGPRRHWGWWENTHSGTHTGRAHTHSGVWEHTVTHTLRTHRHLIAYKNTATHTAPAYIAIWDQTNTHESRTHTIAGQTAQIRVTGVHAAPEDREEKEDEVSGQAGQGRGGEEEAQTPGADQETERHTKETQEDSRSPVKGDGQPSNC